MRKCALAITALLLCLLSAVAKGEPLTLLDGLKIVTQENRLVKIRQQEERISHDDTIIARSKLLPNVSTSYSQAFLEHQPGLHAGSSITPIGESSFYTYQLAVQQILYDFGGVNSLYQAAKLTEETKRLGTKKNQEWRCPHLHSALLRRP